jgi:dsRNA-specific ribonuclease
VKTDAPDNLEELEEIIGYRFDDRHLLTQAMTHRFMGPTKQVSAATLATRGAWAPQPSARIFLADSILGLVLLTISFRA